MATRTTMQPNRDGRWQFVTDSCEVYRAEEPKAHERYSVDEVSLASARFVNHKARKFTAEPLQDCCASASPANNSKHQLQVGISAHINLRGHAFALVGFFAKLREISNV